MSSHRRRAGFTLVEMIVAVGRVTGRTGRTSFQAWHSSTTTA